VAFVGVISNIHSLCTTYHWLAWVCKVPSVVINLVQGFLPAVLLAVLLLLVSIFLRILARLEGIPQKTGVELSLMDRYFLFQVIVCDHDTYLVYFTNKTTERLSGCYTLIWNHRILAWISK